MPILSLLPGSILSAFISLFSRSATLPPELPPIQPPVNLSTSCPLVVDLEYSKNKFNAHCVYLKTKIFGQKAALSDDDIQCTMSLIRHFGYHFEFKNKDSLTTYERDQSILSLATMVNRCVGRDFSINQVMNNGEHKDIISNFDLL